ncbi:MAG: hypothetical protein A2W93_01390 [Bacteroidetes bacterium GWF2_43_63]|nr:MAG: hypothetical protein A2W93_01390 [Bacteroidetes bacterium GWF2_43_63]HBG69461.1 hypothetical protein [Bacteroidales bacterium]HCB61373.1 hypothetical protein [Bacteroidales bacterium]HCY24247.1 hypothetical protein [Bacteroidales bacterium]
MNLKTIYGVLCFCMIFITAVSISQAQVQWTQMGTTINGAFAQAALGKAVAISSNGMVVAAGGPYNDSFDNERGHVCVYEFQNGNWQQKGGYLNGEAPEDEFGCSVSINDNGSIVAVGARDNEAHGPETGEVKVYQYNGGSWIQMGADIDGEASGDQFGSSVSLSADGLTLAVGAPNNDGVSFHGIGEVKIFRYISGAWTQIGSDITGSDYYSIYLGTSVDLDSTGTIVAIGAIEGVYSAYERVYMFNGSDWVQMGGNINAGANVYGAGTSVSLNYDGTILAVGCPYNYGTVANSGIVCVYQYSGGVWTQIGTDIPGEGDSDKFGYSVDVCADGLTLVVGAYNNDGSGAYAGHARVYKYVGGSWIQVGADIDGGLAYDSFGYSVSISGQGETFVAGLANSDGIASFSGQAKVYTSCLPSTGIDTVDGCESFTWIDGNTYFADNNTATCTITNSAGCDSIVTLNLTMYNVDITHNPLSEILHPGDTAYFHAETSGLQPSYQWQSDIGSGFVNLSNSGQYTGVHTDSLKVSNISMTNNNQLFRCLITVNQCTDSTSAAILEVIDNTGLGKNSSDKILIFPNPATNLICIKTPAEFHADHYSIVDKAGKEVLQGRWHDASYCIDISAFTDGSYVLNIDGSGKVVKSVFFKIKE